MYDNGYIVKCRSILTNDICLSEASHKADVFLVCISCFPPGKNGKIDP